MKIPKMTKALGTSNHSHMGFDINTGAVLVGIYSLLKLRGQSRSSHSRWALRLATRSVSCATKHWNWNPPDTGLKGKREEKLILFLI